MLIVTCADVANDIVVKTGHGAPASSTFTKFRTSGRSISPSPFVSAHSQPGGGPPPAATRHPTNC